MSQGRQLLLSVLRETNHGDLDQVKASRAKGVVVFNRPHPAGHMVQVYNLSDAKRWVGADEIGLSNAVPDVLTGSSFAVGEGMSLMPYSAHWLVRSRS